jgi:NADPH2:quinone reductase
MNVFIKVLIVVSADLMKWVYEKKLSFSIHKIYDLENASEAHDDLEGRNTTGKLVLKI